MNWQELFRAALDYGTFLEKYGQVNYRSRWQATLERVQLTSEQTEVLASFKRTMPVLCLAGAWCGDCINQCPILQRFAQATPVIELKFLDRDAHGEVQRELSINGGNRVPVVVFLSEDFLEVARFGERTLSQYRQMARDQLGPACPTGIVTAGGRDTLNGIIQDWLNEFERVQLILRLSPRLRQKHGD